MARRKKHFDGLGIPVLTQVEVYRLTGPVHRTVQIHPAALNLDVSLVYPPRAAYRARVLPGALLDRGDKLHDRAA